MKADLNTIAFFKDLRQTLDKMSDEDAGVLMKALFAHADGDEMDLSEASVLVQIVYPMVADGTDRLADKRAKRSNAGSNKETNEEQTGNKRETKKEQTGNKQVPQNQSQDQDQDQDQISSPIGEKRKAPAGPREKEPKESEALSRYPHLPVDLSCQELEDVWVRFRAMRAKIRKPMTRYAEELLLQDLAKLSGGNRQNAIQIVDQSIKNSWQGLFPLKTASPRDKPADSLGRRRIDYDAAIQAIDNQRRAGA